MTTTLRFNAPIIISGGSPRYRDLCRGRSRFLARRPKILSLRCDATTAFPLFRTTDKYVYDYCTTKTTCNNIRPCVRYKIKPISSLFRFYHTYSTQCTAVQDSVPLAADISPPLSFRTINSRTALIILFK